MRSAGEDVEKLKTSDVASGNAKWCSYCGKKFGGALTKLNISYRMSQQFHSWVYTENICSHKSLYMDVITALFTAVKWWKQPKCPTTDEQINKM